MIKDKKKCAYCGATENLTREHLFPNSIVQRSRKEGVNLSYSDKSEKYFKSDLVIKDVCVSCNNGVLSRLDDEFCSIYDKCMSVPLMPGSNATLSYEYNSLLRALLKISYNSARASADGMKAVKTYRKLIPYIVGKTNSAPNVMLRLQIVTSSKKVNAETMEELGIFEARLLRSAKIPYDGPQHSRFLVRLIAINSFWFYIIIPTEQVNPSKTQAFLKGFSSWHLQPGVPVPRSESKLSIPKEKTTYMHPSLFPSLPKRNNTSQKT